MAGLLYSVNYRYIAFYSQATSGGCAHWDIGSYEDLIIEKIGAFCLRYNKFIPPMVFNNFKLINTESIFEFERLKYIPVNFGAVYFMVYKWYATKEESHALPR
jgi:hypothetical protein